MSWSASVSSVAVKDAVDKLKEAFDASNPTPSSEVTEQFEAVLDSLFAVLPAVQPNPDGLVSIIASGHANPGHQKTPGWSNDCVTLSVNHI